MLKREALFLIAWILISTAILMMTHGSTIFDRPDRMFRLRDDRIEPAEA